MKKIIMLIPILLLALILSLRGEEEFEKAPSFSLKSLKIPHKTFLYSASIDVVKGPLVLYAEIAKKNGWDKMLFSESQETGFYGSANVFVANISTSFEFLNYDSLGYGGSMYRYSEKGGLVCSGGVCRIEEAFEGIKVNVLSRF